MAFSLTDYIPHAMIVGFAAVTGWVFTDHARRDDVRFTDVYGAIEKLVDKIDMATTTQAEQHAEILKILLDHKI